MVLIDDTVRSRTESSAQIHFARGLWRLSFSAMATHCSIAFPGSRHSAEAFCEGVLNWIIEFESKYSRFIPQSLISQINLKAGRDSHPIDPETETIFRLCDELYFLTEQALDPTSLPLTRIWNWKAPNPQIPSKETVSCAHSFVGWRNVMRRKGSVMLPEQGMGLDLGGIGKEYAVDQVTQLAHETGIESILVNFGQDIRCIGSPPDRPAWHIGIESPKKIGNCDLGIGIRDLAVASSGNYRRFFTKEGRSYGHIIDPRTGYPVENDILGVTAVSPSCVLSGALTTAAVILGPTRGLELINRTYGAEGIIRTRDHTFESREFSKYVAH